MKIESIKEKFEKELCFKYMDTKELGLKPITPEQLWEWIEKILKLEETNKKEEIFKLKELLQLTLDWEV